MQEKVLKISINRKRELRIVKELEYINISIIKVGQQQKYQQNLLIQEKNFRFKLKELQLTKFRNLPLIKKLNIQRMRLINIKIDLNKIMITLHFYYNMEKPICEKFQLIPVKFRKNLCQRVRDLKARQQRKKKKKERGKYRSYSLSLKICALKWIEEGRDERTIAEELDIPLKNIRRWKKQGPFRKKGCGRKSIDLEMEQKLAAWCHETIRNTNKRVSRAMIQTQALKMIKQGVDFKASKGWTDKFVRKYKLIRNKRISKS